MSPKTHNLLPLDATPEEVEFLEYSIVNLYSALERREDMFLVAFIHELGYKKELAAQILGLSNGSITNRLKRIQEQLSAGYAKNRVKK
jgi:DNA-directed RNA polymerase specialized sigma24 family protein